MMSNIRRKIANAYIRRVDVKHPLEYFSRFLSGITANLLKRTIIKPNHITLIRLPLFLYILYRFAFGTNVDLVAGFLLLILFYYLDCLDGDLARVKKQITKIGKFFDLCVDVLFGKLAGPFGFALVWNCYSNTKEITPFVVLFIYFWIDFIYNFFIKMKNEFGLGSFTKSDDSTKSINESSKSHRTILKSIAKHIRDIFLFFEIHNSVIIILIFYGLFGPRSLLLPFYFYGAIYLILSITLSGFIIRSIRKEKLEEE